MRTLAFVIEKERGSGTTEFNIFHTSDTMRTPTYFSSVYFNSQKKYYKSPKLIFLIVEFFIYLLVLRIINLSNVTCMRQLGKGLFFIEILLEIFYLFSSDNYIIM